MCLFLKLLHLPLVTAFMKFSIRVVTHTII
jgi:hypothetical protein